MITIQHWNFLGWFLGSFVPFKVSERDNVISVVIIQEETFNQWQRKNQDNFKWHFLQLVNTV